MESYEKSINNLHKMYQQKNRNISNKHNKQIINEVKLTIISLAYSEHLTATDLCELADILGALSNHKDSIKSEDSK